jgi:hypothetical protein
MFPADGLRPVVFVQQRSLPPCARGALHFVPFFLASLALTLTFGATLGVLNLARLTGTWGTLPRPSVWAHGYVQTFGFVGLFIMGFAYHTVPRFAGVALAWPRTVAWTCGLQAGGVLSIVAGLVLAPDLARPLWITGSLALLVAAALFASALWRSLSGRPAPREAFEYWVAAGLLWFVAAAGLALTSALQDDVVWHHLLWPAFLLGGAGSWILGMGRRLFPMSLGWPVRPAFDRPGFLLYQLAVTAHVAGSWPSSSLSAVRVIGATALPIAVLCVARGMGLFDQTWSHAPSNDDGYARHVYAAWVWLLISVGASTAATLTAAWADTFASVTSIDFVRHTWTLGFVTQMIVGIGGRFVPVFAGTWLWSRRAHTVGFWLLNAAVLLRAPEGLIGLGYWAWAWPWLGLAGPPALAALVLFTINMGMTLRIRSRWMERSRLWAASAR